MNILVTGGLGYIGSHVSLALAGLGFNVHIIDIEKEKEKFRQKSKKLFKYIHTLL